MISKQFLNHHGNYYSWLDYLEVMKDITIPEPSEFIHPEFIAFYYNELLWMDRESDPDSKVVRDAINKIEKIIIAPRNLVFEFFYNNNGELLIQERISYKGTPTMEVNYEYGQRGEVISTIQEKYLLSEQEIESKYTVEEAPYSKWKSNTFHFDYTNGQLERIRRTLDYYDDFLYRVYDFEYDGNVRFRTTTEKNPDGEETVDPNVDVEFTLKNCYIETFVVSL